MYAHPGKKLIFMGGEFGQVREWQHEESLEWHVLDFPFHRGMASWVKDLNVVYKNERAFYDDDFSWAGFEWVDFNDSENSVVCFLRKSKDGQEIVLCVFNFTPVVRENYRIGVPRGGFWKELLNSDASEYCGSGTGNLGGFNADNVYVQGREWSLNLKLPPQGAVFFKSMG
jgi:1,4-alpha-glucan branching enzyme